HQVRAGSQWRPMSDTTRDPIIAARSPLPWPSWQRSEDYYTEGSLVWLDVDTRIRELSGDSRSLDDFARLFFGGEEGVWITNTYTFADVAGTLGEIVPFDWSAFFAEKLDRTTTEAPLGGLERGGYRLVYRDAPSAYETSREAVFGKTNLLFSLGLTLSSDGKVGEVLWDGPAFREGLTVGAKIVGVNSRAFSTDEIKRAVACTSQGEPIDLLAEVGKRHKEVRIAGVTGHRFPHLEPIKGARPRLDEILSPLAG
ncbi:MAG TPA: peptidase M61, partial [Sphingomonadaceae bacterium]|nr:peptidase M61 [Sphingomonadaceae bacterium]